MKNALKWGFLLGIASLIWLYLAYWAGLHTGGMGKFNLFMLGWLALNIIGYVFAMKAIRKSYDREAWTWFRGLRLAGAMAATVAAFAIIAQIGYWKVIHPDWPNYLVEQSRIHFEKQGLSETDLQTAVEQTRTALTLPKYAVQSAASHFLLGILLSAITLIFMRDR